MTVLVAAMLSAAGCRSAPGPAIAPGPSAARVVFGRTVRVRFDGNRQLPDATLRSAIHIDKAEPDDESSPRNVLERDSLYLSALYYDHGYMQVDIAPPSVAEASDGPFVDVTFKIKKEGPRFRIGRLTAYEREDTNRPKLLADTEVRARIRPASGDWFSRKTLVEDLTNLRTFYRDRGYANVEANPETDVHEAQGVVDIVIPIERGPLVRVETVVVTGNAKTPLERIKTELRVNEGELFNETRLEETKKHLEQLFKRVDVSTEQGSNVDQMKITFEVVEK